MERNMRSKPFDTTNSEQRGHPIHKIWQKKFLVIHCDNWHSWQKRTDSTRDKSPYHLMEIKRKFLFISHKSYYLTENKCLVHVCVSLRTKQKRISIWTACQTKVHMKSYCIFWNSFVQSACNKWTVSQVGHIFINCSYWQKLKTSNDQNYSATYYR